MNPNEIDSAITTLQKRAASLSFGPNCRLNITGIELVEDVDLPLFNEAIVRARRHLHEPGGEGRLYISARQKSGWLEYALHIQYGGGGGLFIGCIQRGIGEQCEFHT